MSGKYAVLELETRNVTSLVAYDGLVTSPAYHSLSEEDYQKISMLILKENLGVNIAENGLITTYIPASPPLKDQARQALDQAKQYVMNNYAIYNEATPDDWVVYLKALRDIVSGNDTASTKLPQAPVTQDGQ